MAGKDLLQYLLQLERDGKTEEIQKIIESRKYEKNPAFLYFLAHLYYTGSIYKKNIEKAVTYLKEASKKDYASADFMLCTLYERADGVERDYKLSNQYLIKAASKGYIPAVNHYGEILLMGRADIDRNDILGFSRFEYCYKQGYVRSGINLGYCLIYGVGCEADPKRGIEILTKYSDEGYAEAQYNLGKAYFDGIGVERDVIRANYYLQLATENGQLFAAKMLGDCYYDGIGVPMDHATAFKYYRIAADLGNTEAGELATHCYIYGDGVQPDYKEAMSYLVSRAQRGDNKAQIRLADCYMTGTGFRRNYYRAFFWYNEAARHDDPIGNLKVAELYMSGQGVDKNYEKAVEFYEKALELENYKAAYPLAVIFDKGKEGIKRDYNKAVEYYKIAYELNHDEKAAFDYAETLLERAKSDRAKADAAAAYEFAAKKRYMPGLLKAGECYLSGMGVEKDIERGFRYYLIAARMGNQDALKVVDEIRKNVQVNSLAQNK